MAYVLCLVPVLSSHLMSPFPVLSMCYTLPLYSHAHSFTGIHVKVNLPYVPCSAKCARKHFLLCVPKYIEMDLKIKCK